MTALSDLENLRLHDISEGDVRDDPRWQELVGHDPVKAFLAQMAAKHLGAEIPLKRANPSGTHTGAMVALLPSQADAARLAVPGGEPVDELHCTLLYLGKAADIPPEGQAAIENALRAAVEDAVRPDFDLPLAADGFSINLFNPPGHGPSTDGKQRDACIVLGLSGGDLEAIRAIVEDTVHGFEIPAQHEPWTPHVTLIYTDDVEQVAKLVDRAGPIVFDRLRVVFADQVHDIPLRPSSGQRSTKHLPGQHNQLDHGHRGAGDFAARLADALTGQSALDAAPAKLTPGPEGHRGRYEGEKLDGPPGMGSVRALSQYEGVEYQEVNGFLRGDATSQSGPGHLPDDAPEYMRQAADIASEIDKTMAVSRLGSDVRVERVIRNGGRVFGNKAWYGEMDLDSTDDFDEQDRLYERWVSGERPDLTGMRWVDHGFQSTTVDPTVGPKFGERWARLNSPADGEPVIMTFLVPKGTGGIQMSGMGQEAEILLDRGLTMEVAADHGIDDAGFRRLDVRLVGDDE